MCGIVGYVGYRQAPDVLIEGLHRLEYRGYDSAGIAVRNGSGIEILKKAGRVEKLEQLVRSHPVEGTLGIGHTRWAASTSGRTRRSG